MSSFRQVLSPTLLPLALLFAPQSGHAQPAICTASDLLASQTLSGIGALQRHVEAADLDGDGRKDLVVSTPSSIIIAAGALAPGTGGLLNYTPVQVIPGIPDATGTAIADFNGDGIKDIAVAADGGGITLLRGSGDAGVGNGQFVNYTVMNLGSCWDVTAADVTGDGVLDLVVALRGGAVQTLIGQSTAGTPTGFFTAGPVSAAGGSPKGMAVGDINHDGALDVVVATEGPSVDVLLGLTSGGVPTGAFNQAVVLPAGGVTYDVTLADFNRDGWLDIASANYTGAGISVGLAAAGGTFSSMVTLPVPGSPLGIDSGDFNHDGFADVVVASAGSGSSFAYMQNTGVVSEFVSGLGTAVAYGPARTGYGLTATDLDGDGALDVLVPGILQTDLLAAFNRCAITRPLLAVNVTGNGSVAVAPDQPDYALGDLVQLTATPGAGYFFLGWSGDLSGSANPVTLVMNTTKVVTATFAPIQHTLTVTTAGPGTGFVTRTPDRATYDEGSTVALLADASFGSIFLGWSGDANGTDNPVSIVMTADRAVVATFGPDTSLVPHLLSVSDVPLDQGGKLKLRWRASSLEAPDPIADRVVTQYWIWREIPQTAFARMQASAASTGGARVLRTHVAAREYFWEFVVALPASRFSGYSYTASTTSDSSAHGNPYTSFLVQARNASGNRWWDSHPDSGYSVDNLAPPTPAALAVRYGPTGNALHWRPSVAQDLSHYELHRGPTRDFVPSEANRVGSPQDTAYFDPSPSAQYYKLAAVDVHGNHSHYVLVAPELPVGTLASLVAAEVSEQRISLSWYLSQPGLPATLYRRAGDAPWTALAELAANGAGAMRYDDTDIQRGVLYGYRLGIQEAGGEEFYAETYVLAADARFAIDGITPNPSPGGRMTLRFSLPDAHPATVELLDIAGRRVELHSVAGAVGSQSVQLGAARRIAPGLYWVRLRHQDRQLALRAVVLD